MKILAMALALAALALCGCAGQQSGGKVSSVTACMTEDPGRVYVRDGAGGGAARCFPEDFEKVWPLIPVAMERAGMKVVSRDRSSLEGLIGRRRAYVIATRGGPGQTEVSIAAGRAVDITGMDFEMRFLNALFDEVCLLPQPPPPPPPPPQTLICLLADEDGSVGQIAVATPQGELSLASAGDFTDAAQGAPTPPKRMNEEAIRAHFGKALEAMSGKPVSTYLYFENDLATPDAASMELIPKVIEEIKAMPIPFLSIIGHTDTKGTDKYNQRLSIKRAETVRKILIEHGIPAKTMKVYGFSFHDPLVPTPPDTDEPKNRRVEIFLR